MGTVATAFSRYMSSSRDRVPGLVGSEWASRARRCTRSYQRQQSSHIQTPIPLSGLQIAEHRIAKHGALLTAQCQNTAQDGGKLLRLLHPQSSAPRGKGGTASLPRRSFFLALISRFAGHRGAYFGLSSVIAEVFPFLKPGARDRVEEMVPTCSEQQADHLAWRKGQAL